MAAAPGKNGCLTNIIVLVFLASIPSFIIFLFILLVNLSTNGASSHHPSFEDNVSSISLIGSPGKTVAFDLTGQTLDVEGYYGYSGPLWASDTGLNLELSNHSSFDQTFNLIGYVPENWGDSITCSGNCMTDFTINMNFTLPSSLAESADRTLTGSLTGDIITPQSPPDTCNTTDSSGCGQFENVQKQLNIPVNLKLGIITNSGHRQAVEAPLLGTLISFGVLVATFTFLGISGREGGAAR